MKANFLLILTCFLGINGFSQTDLKWEIGLQVSPQQYFGAKDFVFSQYTGYAIAENTFNMSFGLQGGYSFNDKWKVISGLDYSTKNLIGAYYCHVCDLAIQGPEKIKIKFLEIPIVGRYQITNGKFGLHADLGFTTGVLIKAIKTRYEAPLLDIYGGTKSFSRINFSGKTGLGLDYQLSERLRLGVTGFYTHSFFTRGNHDFRSVGLHVALVRKF